MQKKKKNRSVRTAQPTENFLIFIWTKTFVFIKPQTVNNRKKGYGPLLFFYCFTFMCCDPFMEIHILRRRIQKKKKVKT